jgi:hypothetical protein
LFFLYTHIGGIIIIITSREWQKNKLNGWTNSFDWIELERKREREREKEHKLRKYKPAKKKKKIAQIENEIRTYLKRINEVDFDYFLLLIFDRSYF